MTSKTHSNSHNENTTETKMKTNWTYWGIYQQYGMKGSIWNILHLNPIIIILVIIEIITNAANTYAMTAITRCLMKLANDVSNSNTINPTIIIDNDKMTDQISIQKFMLLLGLIVFATDITKIANRLLRKWSLFYTHRIIRRIKYAVINHINLAPPEIRQEYCLDERFEAINQFVWTYENITSTLIETIIKTSRFLTFCSYIVYEEPRLLFGIFIIYVTMWKYVIPHTINDTDSNGRHLWIKTYYDMLITESFNINPLYEKLYHLSEEKENSNVDNCNIDDLSQDDMSQDDIIMISKKKMRRPNTPEKYMKILKYYTLKNKKWNDMNDNFQFAQNMMTYIIIMLMFMLRNYETAIILLINRSTMFAVLTCYSDIQNCEKNSERHLEKITKILNAIDEYFETNKNKIVTQLIKSDVAKVNNEHIISLSIDGLKIVIPSNKTIIPKSTDSTDSIECTKQSMMRYIALDTTTIYVTPHKCLLLEGRTGCGKSVTINAIAGLYSGSICKNMYATISSKNSCGSTSISNINTEFNQITEARCYINQLLTDDYKYNGSIQLSLYKLFPGAKTMDHVANFLKSVFSLKDSSIPASLTDTPPLKLSGGELQRYVVASQIWQIKKVKPDIVILDEIDRALDKETAIKVISWIIDNISSYFIIVSHLTEVKQMLFDKNCINQIWTFDEISDSQQIKICTNCVN